MVRGDNHHKLGHGSLQMSPGPKCQRFPHISMSIGPTLKIVLLRSLEGLLKVVWSFKKKFWSSFAFFYFYELVVNWISGSCFLELRTLFILNRNSKVVSILIFPKITYILIEKITLSWIIMNYVSIRGGEGVEGIEIQIFSVLQKSQETMRSTLKRERVYKECLKSPSQSLHILQFSIGVYTQFFSLCPPSEHILIIFPLHFLVPFC